MQQIVKYVQTALWNPYERITYHYGTNVNQIRQCLFTSNLYLHAGLNKCQIQRAVFRHLNLKYEALYIKSSSF